MDRLYICNKADVCTGNKPPHKCEHSTPQTYAFDPFFDCALMDYTDIECIPYKEEKQSYKYAIAMLKPYIAWNYSNPERMKEIKSAIKLLKEGKSDSSLQS